MTASAPTRLPTSLRVLAVLYIILGASYALSMVLALLHSRISLEFGVLYLFIGPGLLNLRRGWRTCALVFIWLGFIFIPIFCLLAISQRTLIPFTFFGVVIGHISSGAAFIAAIAFFLFNLWQYRVLTSPNVRRLFGLT